MQGGEFNPSVAEYQPWPPLCQSAKVFIWSKDPSCEWTEMVIESRCLLGAIT